MSKIEVDKPISTQNLNFDWVRQEAETAKGFFYETERHVIAYFPGKDRLLVSFDNLASLKTKAPRKPWGHDLAQKQGWESLGVMTKKNDWFRSV